MLAWLVLVDVRNRKNCSIRRVFLFPLAVGSNLCVEAAGSGAVGSTGQRGERLGPAEPACATCRHTAARGWGSALDISCLILFPITRLAELCQHAEELENNSSCACLSSLLASRHPSYPSQLSNTVYFSSQQRSALRCLTVWLWSCSTDLPVCSQRLLRTHLVPGRMVPRHCSCWALGGPSTLSSAGSPLGNSWRSHTLLRAFFPLFDLSGLISP